MLCSILSGKNITSSVLRHLNHLIYHIETSLNDIKTVKYVLLVITILYFMGNFMSK